MTYNLAVARAFLRQVYVAEGLAPPNSVEAFTSVYRTLFERGKNPAYWREIAQSGEWAKVALYGIEAYGIFHIGEMSERKLPSTALAVTYFNQFTIRSWSETHRWL